MIHEWFNAWPPWLAVFVVAMIPVLEMRASIPLGYFFLDMGLVPVLMWSFVGNLVPIPLVLQGLPVAERWARRWQPLRRGLDWFFGITRRRHSKKVERAEEVGLALFVALPLPGAGTWSGALAAHVLGLPLRSSLLSIFAGAVIEVAVIGAVVVSGEFLWLLVV